MRNLYSTVLLVLLVSSLSAAQPFKLGVENIPAQLRQLCHQKSVALVTDQSACDQHGRSSLSCLLKEGIPVSKLFSSDNVMHLDKSRLVSLYDLSRLEEEGESIDVFVVDLTGFGLRHALSLTALAQLLSFVSQHNKEIVVLDRPNPLGCRMEGPLGEQIRDTTEAVLPIPFRHGMTLGEIAWFCNMHCVARPAKLQVVCMKGYRRDDVRVTDHESAPQLFQLLSEVNPLSVNGREIMFPTTEPPTLWSAFADSLQGCGLTVASDNKVSEAHLSVTIPDSNRVSSFKTMLYMLDFFKEHSIQLSLSDVFDAFVGTSKMRDYLEGDCSFETFASAVNDDLAYFYRKARSSFMYMPLPEVCELAHIRV